MKISKSEDIRQLYFRLKSEGKLNTWEDFSKKIGYDRTYVSRVINNKEPLVDDFARKVESVFGAAQNVPREAQQEGAVKMDYTGELIESLRNQISLLKEKCEGLETDKADLKLVVQRQAEMFGYLHALAHHLVKLRVKAEKMTEDQLRVETNNIVAQFLENGSVKDRLPKVGNGHKLKA